MTGMISLDHGNIHLPSILVHHMNKHGHCVSGHIMNAAASFIPPNLNQMLHRINSNL
ncbi:hypothetical protein OIU78_010422 [Salix suchowensis]|nr:hypothetical protein OIU78_010422 [Salix suchowensis]